MVLVWYRETFTHMIVTQNTSVFFESVLEDGCIIYDASKHGSPSFSSFDEALNPLTYSHFFYAFAYVVLNENTQEFLLVRDHLGVQPLYYTYDNVSKTLIFGDTIPDVLRQIKQHPGFSETEILNLFTDANVYSDDTVYQGVHRVEPGHMIHGKLNGQLVKKPFWRLEKEGDELYYRDKREYLEHFSELMDEAIAHATSDSGHIAAEFSAGMDSTTVYLASVARGLNPELFMHAATPGSRSAETYNTYHEQAFMNHYPHINLNCIRADGFEPLKVFENYAAWFAGPSPYIFEVFAHNIHRAVSEKKYSILLSGFGGDQGVSGHIPARFILPQLIHQKLIGQAWHELSSQTKSRRVLRLIQYSHPALHHMLQQVQGLRKTVHLHPYQKGYYKTLREAEWDFLQGPFSYEVRMRIEYSSIVSKKMGFEYRYPLLYPKLLAFFLSLPLSEKRHQGVGRYMMRRYLARQMPSAVFDDYQKREGLNILPATVDYFKPKFLAGDFDEHFQALPYQHLIQDNMQHRVMIKSIQAFMLKAFQSDT
ncbi:MAG: asparagine synthase-related protein [Legionellaceae bacterium]|nr:asparagine synthase-related protein [Legionellaceae bacterium]